MVAHGHAAISDFDALFQMLDHGLARYRFSRHLEYSTTKKGRERGESNMQEYGYHLWPFMFGVCSLYHPIPTIGSLVSFDVFGIT